MPARRQHQPMCQGINSHSLHCETSLFAARSSTKSRVTAALLLVVILSASSCVAQQKPDASIISSRNNGKSVNRQAWAQCDTETQMVMCGDIPLTKEFRSQRISCCRLYKAVFQSANVQAADAAAVQQQYTIQQQVLRGDLTGDLRYAPNYHFGKCTNPQQATIPVFSGRSVSQKAYSVPQLSSDMIKRVKSKVWSGLPQDVKNDVTKLRSFNSGSGFQHPGTCAGPVELALMKYRLRNGNPVTAAARDSLLTGNGVKRKYFPSPEGGTWHPPTNCPAEGYAGPYPVSKMQIKWSGLSPSGPCPGNYPTGAPKINCQHISFVELDAQMCYKMALAWHVTGDDRYATKVLQILDAHAGVNKEWGIRWENGPLEAGWGVATMSRALELVRSRAWPGLISKFVNWVNAVPMKDMDHYVDVISKPGWPNMFGNWHSTVAEAFIAFGVLADDRGRYSKGVRLFHATVADYLKWGKSSFANGRVLGECSETMRDLYHAQFGLGGLLQAAEIAWQQNEDLYSSSNYALPAAMELHARITNAWLNTQDSNMLPNGFKFYSSMPTPPAGTRWQFDMKKQRWAALYTSNGAWHSDLLDNTKYLLGIGFLPTGWELGYNHYVGRLGMQLPETAALLARSWPEWQEMQWGLGTLTHAHTAQTLWRDGIKDYTLCASRAQQSPGQKSSRPSPSMPGAGLASNLTDTVSDSVSAVEGAATDGISAAAAVAALDSTSARGGFVDPQLLVDVLPSGDDEAARELVLLTVTGEEASVDLSAPAVIVNSVEAG